MLVTQLKHQDKVSVRPNIFLPVAFLCALTAIWIMVDAVLPLHGLFFASAQLTQLSQRFLQPSQILFPGLTLITTPSLPFPSMREVASETPLLLGAFVLLFLCYGFALRYLPQKIGLRYIVIGTIIFGAICVVIPAVTSLDLFSYIIYGRMWVIYHLNPLATLPLAVAKDPVYMDLRWRDQPSAYGPTWIVFVGMLQWFVNTTGTRTNLSDMVLLLRVSGLIAHLCSILLVWSISGTLQRTYGQENRTARVLATLAFGWNPLLLFEASVNAHNDTMMLLLILAGLWFLLRNDSLVSCACAALLLALATCLKVNAALLVPGILIYLWLQPHRFQKLATVLLVYLGVVITLYAPFWNHGTIITALNVNPGTYRNINTLADFLGQFYNSVRHTFGAPPAPEIGSRIERLLHTLSLILFVLAYVVLLWQALFTRRRLNTPLRLVRWMAVAWFLYCLVGAPWFWPWYTVTFFGLFALVAANMTARQSLLLWAIFGVFAFNLLSIYTFFAGGIYKSYVPFLLGFRWSNVRGVWVWVPVLLLLLFAFYREYSREKAEVRRM